MDSNFDVGKFATQVEHIRNLMTDYMKVRADLDYFTKKLDSIYTSDASPSLETLYMTEDKQFDKCIDAVCIYQDMISSFYRLEENEHTMFTIRKLEKELDLLPSIESHFYFDLLDY